MLQPPRGSRRSYFTLMSSLFICSHMKIGALLVNVAKLWLDDPHLREGFNELSCHWYNIWIFVGFFVPQFRAQNFKIFLYEFWKQTWPLKQQQDGISNWSPERWNQCKMTHMRCDVHTPPRKKTRRNNLIFASEDMFTLAQRNTQTHAWWNERHTHTHTLINIGLCTDAHCPHASLVFSLLQLINTFHAVLMPCPHSKFVLAGHRTSPPLQLEQRYCQSGSLWKWNFRNRF